MINLHVRSDGKTWFGVACNEEKVFATSFGFRRLSVLRSLLDSIPFNAPFQCLNPASTLAEHVLSLVRDVFYGNETNVTVPFALEHLSKYAQSVINVISLIPIGYVTSYSSVAHVSGGSARAVGRVMAHNHFAPIIPCHRVIRSDFTLGGYGYGPRVKLDLLKRENRGYVNEKDLRVKGRSFKLFPIDFVLRRVH